MNPSTFRTRIEGMLAMMDAVERPKKYRALVRNIFVPAHQGELEKVFYLLGEKCSVVQNYFEYTFISKARKSNSLVLRLH